MQRDPERGRTVTSPKQCRVEFYNVNKMDKEAVDILIRKARWKDILRMIPPGKTKELSLPFPSAVNSFRVAAAKLNVDSACPTRFSLETDFNKCRVVVVATSK